MISLATGEDIPAIQDFLDRYWKPDYLLAKDTDFFRWQFLSRHANRVNFVVSRDADNALDAILGFIPSDHHDAHDPGRPPFLWLVNWMVRPGGGRPGLGMLLQRYLERTLEHTGLGTIGVNRSALAFYQATGFVTGEMDHHVLVNPSRKDFFLLEAATQAPVVIPNPAGAVLHELEGGELPGLVRRDPTCFNKGTDYYRQRYLAHPIYRYRCLLLKLGDRSLVLFVRRADAAGSSCLRIVECVGDFALLRDAAAALAEYVAASGAEYIDLVSKNVLPAGETGPWQDARGLAAPNHFEPYEPGFRRLLFAWRLRNEALTPRLFRGDCDQDAPRQPA